MAMFDLSIDQLRTYAPQIPEPEDLQAFWAGTLRDARAHDPGVTCTPVDNGLVLVDTYDVTFGGFDGQPVRAWLHLPVGRERPLPGVVEYIGYGSGRGLSHERLMWAAAGYAHLVMDTRGQGSGRSVGATPDPVGSAPAAPGSMTQGILDPHTYYYRRLFTDAVRAVDVMRTFSAVDPARVAAAGTSQGGGMAIAVAGLADGLAAVMADVPFLCHFRRATQITDSLPYAEITRYLRAHRDQVDQVFSTLAYFDGAVLGQRADAPALFSAALMDDICPPSTVFAAYNRYAGTKDIRVYPYNTHEGGEAFHHAEQLRWLPAHLR